VFTRPALWSLVKHSCSYISIYNKQKSWDYVEHSSEIVPNGSQKFELQTYIVFVIQFDKTIYKFCLMNIIYH